MNSAQATQIVAAFASAFPSTRLPEGTAELWVRALGGIAFDPALLAMEEWIRTETFFPTIAGFNSVLRNHRNAQQRELPEPQDFGQWVPVAEGRQVIAKGYVDECRKQGREPTPKMLDRIANFPNTDLYDRP